MMNYEEEDDLFDDDDIDLLDFDVNSDDFEVVMPVRSKEQTRREIELWHEKRLLKLDLDSTFDDYDYDDDFNYDIGRDTDYNFG
ncbi:hypothetical protein [Psychromonas sp. MME2]|uniref:hypothetical protein n=1 Tax=unclassified Psychromonas TaxID=2614957 RepID=UPI00339D2624